MIAGESEKSDFRSDQSGGSDWPVNFTLYHYTGFFFLTGRERGRLTGMRIDVFRTTERNGAERSGVTFCVPLTNPQIENLRGDRADFQEKRSDTRRRVCFSACTLRRQTGPGALAPCPEAAGAYALSFSFSRSFSLTRHRYQLFN